MRILLHNIMIRSLKIVIDDSSENRITTAIRKAV